MIFSSATFILFFLALLALYAVASTPRQRAAIVLVGSFIFYASWKPAYLILLIAELAFNYWIYRILLEQRSKALLIFGIVVDLGVLAVFKYLAFLTENLFEVLDLVGLAAPTQAPGWMDWALPLGISFFTFQMLSALIDVYRGEWSRRISFAHWCLYVSFFPQFIAGPIVRAHELVDQVGALQPLRLTDLRLGAVIFAGGLVKKALFADNLGPIADQLYASPGQLDFYTAWLATTAFSLQIYFDFSGYSEMALGLARMLGVEVPRNFRYPYISRNFSEFWRRWHITLSQWLRDYLYFPLGGSRGSHARTVSNLVVTMFLGGLWHGAGWTFVFWGLLHGLFLVVYHLLTELYQALGVPSRPRLASMLSWLGLPLTYILTSFTWVFFRAENFPTAWTVCAAMLGLADSGDTVLHVRHYQQLIIAAGVLLVAVEPLLVRSVQRAGIEWWWQRVPFVVRGGAYASLALITIIFGGATQKFIYFDF